MSEVITLDYDTDGSGIRMQQTIEAIERHNQNHPMPNLDVEKLKAEMEKAIETGSIIVIDSLGSFVAKSREELNERGANIIGFGGVGPRITEAMMDALKIESFNYVGAEGQLPPVREAFKGAFTEQRRSGNNKKWHVDRSIKKKMAKASKQRNRR
jgi:hypothetical protein